MTTVEAVTATPVAMSAPVASTTPVTTSTEGECDHRPVPGAIVGIVVIRVAPVPRTMPMPVVPPTAPAAISAMMATVVNGFDARRGKLL